MDKNKYNDKLCVKDSHISEEELFEMLDESIRQIDRGEYYTQEEVDEYFRIKYGYK